MKTVKTKTVKTVSAVRTVKIVKIHGVSPFGRGNGLWPWKWPMATFFPVL